MRRAARTDKHHEAIVGALRQSGASVQSLAAIGKGCPDLLVAIRGRMLLLEVKTKRAKAEQTVDKKAEPNQLQQDWHAQWHAPVHVVFGPADAVALLEAA